MWNLCHNILGWAHEQKQWNNFIKYNNYLCYYMKNFFFIEKSPLMILQVYPVD